MRILFLNSEYPPLGGGAASATHELFRSFSAMPDVQVDCVTASIDNQLSVQKPWSTITLHHLPIGDKRNSLHYQTNANLLTYGRRAWRYTRELMAKQQYDIVHAFFTLPAGYIAYGLRRKIPYIISLRGSDVPGYNNRFAMIYALTRGTTKRIWKNAAHVVANSDQLATLAQATLPELPIPVIPNGIDTDAFSPADCEPSTAERFTVLCVSRLIERKGIDQLIRAVATLRDSTPAIHLELVGEGNIQNQLQQLAQDLGVTDRVHFRGRIDHGDLPTIYRKAHLFALASQNEGMSNTVLEAMASGLPLILTNTGDAATLTAGNGILLPQRDTKAIVEALRRLINDAGVRASYRAASRQKAFQYSWASTAQAYIQLYTHTINSV